MPQSIDFELNEDTDEFHLILDGEDKGSVDMEDLRESASSLHIHFHMFRYAPEYPPDEEKDATMRELEEAESLSDEEVDELIEELDEIELSEEEHEDAESDLQELRDE